MAFVCYLPQVVAYVTLYGGLTSPYNLDERMLWHAPHFGDVLASPRHGFFFWTPLAAVALAGLGWFAATGAGRIGAADARRIGICLLAMFASQAYIAGSITRWTLAGSFGQRRFVGTTIILAIGVGGGDPLGSRGDLGAGRTCAPPPSGCWSVASGGTWR